MAEPVTTNRALIVPNTGDLASAWGTAALNPNFQMVDGMFGGVVSISLSSATTFALTAASSTGNWTGSLPQQSNALIKFTGTLSGNAVVQFTQPGFYIVHNQCTVGNYYVQLSPSGAGNKIGAPPGQKIHVYFDGTDMDYVNMPAPATRLDLHGYTAIPNWMSACTVAPYLLRNGATYSTATYPALAAILGSTFGGNGATTFGVPDSRARVDIPLDVTLSGATSGRITFPIAGFTGSLLGAVGGDQNLHAHNHGYTDPGHSHGGVIVSGNSGNYQAGLYGAIGSLNGGGTSGSGIGITINNAGSGASQNVQPSIVSVLPLIKT